MARWRTILFSFLVSSFLIYTVTAVRNSLPEKQLTRQLRARNKQPTKTITTEHGDVYDCIDFYKQPAFDHPLLKNHDFHFDMKPSFVPSSVKNDGKKDRVRNKIELQGVDCPTGTVPIRRTTREDVIREEEFLQRPSKVNAPVDNKLGNKYIAGTAITKPDNSIFGAWAYLSVNNPSVKSSSQYSSSVIAIDGGNEFIHVGWTVHPSLYGDLSTRLYTCFNGAKASCYNTHCPGFVVVNPNYPLDVLLMTPSGRPVGVGNLEVQITVYQDTTSGNWWLLFGEDTKNIEVGFWPKRLFRTLSETVTKVFWGGVVFVPRNTAYPQMGSGYYPKSTDDFTQAATCRQISIVDKQQNSQLAISNSSIFGNFYSKYNVVNYIQGYVPSWDSTVIFGGQ